MSSTYKEERDQAESDLDCAIALIDWIIDIPMFDDHRIATFAAWAGFNDAMAGGGKYHWKFLKDCGLLRSQVKSAKVEYKIHKKLYRKRYSS
jgi:hypothetical protein